MTPINEKVTVVSGYNDEDLLPPDANQPVININGQSAITVQDFCTILNSLILKLINVK